MLCYARRRDYWDYQKLSKNDEIFGRSCSRTLFMVCPMIIQLDFESGLRGFSECHVRCFVVLGFVEMESFCFFF